MIILIFIMSMLLNSGHAFAATELGNGGDVLLCTQKDGTQTAELLDLWEGRTFRNDIHEFPDGQNFLEIADGLLNRLQKFDPLLSSFYKTRVKEIYSDFNLLSNVKLIDIPDSNHLFYPTNCTVEQIIIRLADVRPAEHRFLVSKNLWDLLDNNNKAALLIHEAIYEHLKRFIENEKLKVDKVHGDSREVRHFNSAIATSNFKNWTLQTYSDFQGEVTGLETMVINGRRFYCGASSWNGWQIQFYENGKLAQAELAEDSLFDTNYGTILGGGLIKFYESEKVKSIEWVRKNSFIDIGNQKYQLGSVKTSFKDNALEFAENGTIISANLGNDNISVSEFGTPLREHYSYPVECLIGYKGDCFEPKLAGLAQFDQYGKMIEATVYAKTGFKAQGRNSQLIQFEITASKIGEEYFKIKFDSDGYILNQ